MLRHILVGGHLAVHAFAQGSIHPGIPWYDTEDKLLQAHGGSVIELDGIYHLIGENKTKTERNPRGNYFNSVSVRNSTS